MEDNFDNIQTILNMLKENNTENKQDNKEQKEERFLNINSTNKIKTILPLLMTENNENINKMINCLEINQILTEYKQAYNKIDKKNIIDLKKEAIFYIKENVNEDKKYMADLFLKIAEIKHILNNNKGGY